MFCPGTGVLLKGSEGTTVHPCFKRGPLVLFTTLKATEDVFVVTNGTEGEGGSRTQTDPGLEVPVCATGSVLPIRCRTPGLGRTNTFISK